LRPVGDVVGLGLLELVPRVEARDLEIADEAQLLHQVVRHVEEIV
jgi:hypothetical protein